MDIVTVNQAIKVLNSGAENERKREKAIWFLKDHPNSQTIERLVEALEDDDFGVRVEASRALSSMGRDALIALLTALTDPDRVGNPRLRNGAYRILEHINVPDINHLIWKLMLAIKGPAADIVTMTEAFKLLQVLHKHEGENHPAILH